MDTTIGYIVIVTEANRIYKDGIWLISGAHTYNNHEDRTTGRIPDSQVAICTHGHQQRRSQA